MNAHTNPKSNIITIMNAHTNPKSNIETSIKSCIRVYIILIKIIIKIITNYERTYKP